MATIEIHRPFCYNGAAGLLKVWVDGIPLGNIRTLKTEQFNVSDAPHSIQVSQSWCRSVPFEVDMSNGKTVTLTAMTKWWFPIAFLLEFIRPSLVFTIIPKKNI